MSADSGRSRHRETRRAGRQTCATERTSFARQHELGLAVGGQHDLHGVRAAFETRTEVHRAARRVGSVLASSRGTGRLNCSLANGLPLLPSPRDGVGSQS